MDFETKRGMDMKKKVAITGANGYIGRFVTQTLLDNGYDVTASDLRLDDLDPRASVCREPIFHTENNIYEKLGKPDCCIHLAWKDGFVHNSPSHMENLSAHYEFLKKMADSGCHDITVMGSMHEVGYWEGRIDQDTPCNPLSLYGIAKNALRQSLILLSKERGIHLKWLRAYYILGDDLHNNSIFTKLIKADQEGVKEFPFTSGKNQYDFIHVRELGRQIAAAAIQNDFEGIINTCTGKPVSLGEKVESFIKERSLNIRLKYGAFPDRAYDSPIEYGDSRIIEKILAATELKEG